MRVIALKTELRCKLCKHPDRAYIDELLSKRSQRLTDPVTGAQINLDYVLDALRELGVSNPTEENVKNHWKKHCSLVDDAEAEAEERREGELQEEAVRIFERVLGPDWRDRSPGPDQVLELQRALWAHKLHLELRDGKLPDITQDQILKNVGEQSRRRQDEAARELLGSLTGAIGAAMVKTVLPKPEPVLELEPADYVEVDDG
jgi:hypothetical protein